MATKINFTIPLINLEFQDVKEIIWSKVQEPHIQRRLVLVIVCIALLLDNMLYMVIVPIIPDYLRELGTFGEEEVLPNNGTLRGTRPHAGHQDSATGFLFASKAIVQLMVNPFSGALIDRIGYELPMMVGLIIMFLSTLVFACGGSYSVLFFARSLQGAGSAFADTAGLAMIADRFTEESERSRALGIALAFISFGCLVAPPFGGTLYQFAGRAMPFLILALICGIDGGLLMTVMKPIKEQLRVTQNESPQETIPIWRLMMDPYIAVCAGALTMANVSLAFLEPTISLWMEDNITTDNWKIGMIWLPAFFPHVFGVVLTVKMARMYPHKQWLMAAVGLALEGVCCLLIPFATSCTMLIIPICGICFGIALIDTALLPTLGYLVDVRYVSIYGSVYAIADISYSVAYALGPIIAGGIVEAIGFTSLNVLIAISNLGYAPVLMYLKHIYDFKPFESEANILMSDPPKKEYQTYSMQDQRQVDGGYKNHLEYGGQDGGAEAETNIDQDGNGYQQQYQPGYQEQGGTYRQQPGRPVPQQRQLPPNPAQAPVANPFRQQQQQPQPDATAGKVSNPFRQF